METTGGLQGDHWWTTRRPLVDYKETTGGLQGDHWWTIRRPLVDYKETAGGLQGDHWWTTRRPFAVRWELFSDDKNCRLTQSHTVKRRL